VDVRRGRVLEDAAHQVGVLVAHDEAPGDRNSFILCLLRPAVRSERS
jgi:hypothetical protein